MANHNEVQTTMYPSKPTTKLPQTSSTINFQASPQTKCAHGHEPIPIVATPKTFP